MFCNFLCTFFIALNKLNKILDWYVVWVCSSSDLSCGLKCKTYFCYDVGSPATLLLSTVKWCIAQNVLHLLNYEKNHSFDCHVKKKRSALYQINIQIKTNPVTNACHHRLQVTKLIKCHTTPMSASLHPLLVHFRIDFKDLMITLWECSGLAFKMYCLKRALFFSR